MNNQEILSRIKFVPFELYKPKFHLHMAIYRDDYNVRRSNLVAVYKPVMFITATIIDKLYCYKFFYKDKLVMNSFTSEMIDDCPTTIENYINYIDFFNKL